MQKRYFLIIILLLFFRQELFSQDQIYNINKEKYLYQKPNTFDFLLKVPTATILFGNEITKKYFLISNLVIFSSTALFIYCDQTIYNKTFQLGKNFGIGNEDNTKTLLSVANFPVFRGPTDVGSAMYFIGDGWTHLGLSLSFLTAGLLNNDNRALQTASQIAQGMVTVGLTTQLLKHITGRETPGRATSDGGTWRFFPNQIDYHKKVPKYDAFPSGHVATAMMTLTVIANNYEEYKWIRPLGYGLLTLLSFQMINNGVHWISDYPLAIGLGYLFGKIAVEGGRIRIKNNVTKSSHLFKIFPIINSNSSIGLTINYTF